MFISMRLSVLKFTTILVLILATMASSCIAQQQGKCSYCVFVPRDSELSGKCQAGAVNETCHISGTECPYECSYDIGCGRTASTDPASAKCTEGRLTAKLVRELAQNGEMERREAEDAEIRRNLEQNGGASVRVEPQFKGPVTFTWSRHTAKDMLAAAQVLNVSDKTVTAIRIGWLVRVPGEPDEVKVGNWIALAESLEPERLADIPAQNIDTAPLWKAGTIVRFYVAQVKFEDTSMWEHAPQTKPSQNQASVRFPTPSTDGTKVK